MLGGFFAGNRLRNHHFSKKLGARSRRSSVATTWRFPVRVSKTSCVSVFSRTIQYLSTSYEYSSPCGEGEMFLARLPGQRPCFSRVQITQSLILNRVASILICLSPYGPRRKGNSDSSTRVTRGADVLATFCSSAQLPTCRCQSLQGSFRLC